MATVDLHRGDDGWSMPPPAAVGPYASADPDTARIWWSDTGVHQNLTFPVHPDPISGMHCWHQAVSVRPAEPGDAHGDIAVDTGKAREVYQQWMEQTRPAGQRLTRRHPPAEWLMRPLKPSAAAFRAARSPARRPGRPHERRPLGAAARAGRRGRQPRRRPLRRPPALGLDPVSDAEHTDAFVLNCPPYASIYLGPQGAIGGEGADRVAGFWRAIGITPPAEPDHLAALLGLYARLGEAAAGARRPATAAALAQSRGRAVLGASVALAARLSGRRDRPGRPGPDQLGRPDAARPGRRVRRPAALPAAAAGAAGGAAGAPSRRPAPATWPSW